MTFESGLGTSYDTSLVKPIEVSYVLIESDSDNIRCNSQETGSRIKRMLLFFRQKYANIIPTAILPADQGPRSRQCLVGLSKSLLATSARLPSRRP